MALDVLPINPRVRCREGERAVIAMLFRDHLNAPVTRSSLATSGCWDLRVYDELDASPETPIYTLLAQEEDATCAGVAVWPTSVLANGQSPTPAGHNFLYTLDPVALFAAVGGRQYTLEVTARLGTVSSVTGGVIVARVALSVDHAYN